MALHNKEPAKPIISNPCPKCKKLHAIYSSPYRDQDPETGFYEIYQDKTCVCGYKFVRVFCIYENNRWGGNNSSSAEASRAASVIADDKLVELYKLLDEGRPYKYIKAKLHVSTDSVQKYARKRTEDLNKLAY